MSGEGDCCGTTFKCVVRGPAWSLRSLGLNALVFGMFPDVAPGPLGFRLFPVDETCSVQFLGAEAASSLIEEISVQYGPNRLIP